MEVKSRKFSSVIPISYCIFDQISLSWVEQHIFYGAPTFLWNFMRGSKRSNFDKILKCPKISKFWEMVTFFQNDPSWCFFLFWIFSKIWKFSKFSKIKMFKVLGTLWCVRPSLRPAQRYPSSGVASNLMLYTKEMNFRWSFTLGYWCL